MAGPPTPGWFGGRMQAKDRRDLQKLAYAFNDAFSYERLDQYQL